jgi:hypothetical protein
MVFITEAQNISYKVGNDFKCNFKENYAGFTEQIYL